MKKQYFVLLISVLCVIPLRIHAETARGVFGIPTVESVEPSAYIEKLIRAEINTVFVPPDSKTVKWFSKHGFKVCVSVNCFGGKNRVVYEIWR